MRSFLLENRTRLWSTRSAHPHPPCGPPRPAPHLDVGVLGAQVHVGQPRQALQVQHEGQALLPGSVTGLGHCWAPGRLLSHAATPVATQAWLPTPPQPPCPARWRQPLVPRRTGTRRGRHLQREEAVRTSPKGGCAGSKPLSSKGGVWSPAPNGSSTPCYCGIRAAINMLINQVNTQWLVQCQGLAPLHLNNLQVYSGWSLPSPCPPSLHSSAVPLLISPGFLLLAVPFRPSLGPWRWVTARAASGHRLTRAHI